MNLEKILFKRQVLFVDSFPTRHRSQSSSSGKKTIFCLKVYKNQLFCLCKLLKSNLFIDYSRSFGFQFQLYLINLHLIDLWIGQHLIFISDCINETQQWRNALWPNRLIICLLAQSTIILAGAEEEPNISMKVFFFGWGERKLDKKGSMMLM